VLNTVVAGYRLDAYWPSARLVVEIDGFAFHSSAALFESDRRRDAELAAAGVRVMRVTWRQLEGEPHAVVARVAQALVHAKSA
jgi:very-short-patch-repair endonuclease